MFKQPKEGAAEGTRVKIGETEYLVPPLNMKSLKALAPRLATIGEFKPGVLPTTEQFTLVSEMAYMAISRNYPDVKMEELDEGLDLGNILSVFTAIIKTSGLEPSPGEAAAGTQ